MNKMEMKGKTRGSLALFILCTCGRLACFYYIRDDICHTFSSLNCIHALINALYLRE